MLKRNKVPRRDQSSKSGEETTRWSLRRLIPESGRSSQAAPARDHRPNEEGVVAMPSGHTAVVDRVELPNVQKTAAASIEAVGPSESCAANDRRAPKAGEAQATDRKSLWDLAYDALERKKPEVAKAYEKLLLETGPYLEAACSTADLNDLLSKGPGNLPSTPSMLGASNTERLARSVTTRQEIMEAMISLGKKHMEGKKIAFNAGSQEFVLQDQIQHVVTGIQLGVEWIDNAVKASPLASAAWASVCLFLPLLTNQSDVEAANNEGFAYVTEKIQYYTAMESRLFGNDDEEFPPAFKDHVIELYQEIVDFQAQSVLRFFRSRFRNFVRDAVKWDPWEDMLKRVKELGARVERESLQINVALSRAALGALAKKAIETEEDKCLQCFKRGDYAWYKNRLEERVPDTCLWFLNHSSYRSWLSAESGPLLVSADPGCGKSVLAKYLIDSRFGFSLPKEAVVCYFFFKDTDQHTIDLALCALIHQLLCLRPQLIRHALPRYKQDGESLKTNVTALWDILEAATADPEAGTVVIVLDALDECLQDERNMSTLSRYIKTHFESSHKPHLKILVTSRPYEGTIGAIQTLEKSFVNIRIRGEDESETIRKEINSVIEYRVDRLAKFNDDPQLKLYLKRRLMDVTHRTYLWLYLVFDYLENSNIKSTVKGLGDAINHLPSSVNQAYENILNRSTDPEEARKVLLILLAGYRPLTLREFQIALGVTIDTPSLEDLDLEPDEAFKRRLRGVCGSFVTVHDGKVYFLHQTAREFLLPLVSAPKSTTASTDTTNWANKFSTRSAHMALAEACTVYLALLTPAGADVESGFLDYSATNWGHHFREACFGDGAAILPFALKICDPDSTSHSRWFQTFWHYTYPLSYTAPKFTVLMTASYFGHEAVVRLLLDKGAEIEDKGTENISESLSWAAYCGHEPVVRLLLDYGAEVDEEESSDNRRPLHFASRDGHEAVVRLLLDRGADIELSTSSGWTPLSVAAWWEAEAVVRLLLEKGANIDPSDVYGRTPLSWAAEHGHERMVRLLLEKGAQTESMDAKHGRTPLSWAARIGSATLVRMLLDRGAKIESRDSYGRTPLSWATENVDDVVRLLLERGAEIESRDRRGRTPLSWAAKRGSQTVVQLLLENGAQTEPRDTEDGWTPLALAAQYGHEAVVRLLLDMGAEVDSVDRSGRTPLALAAQYGHEAVVRLLLDKGAEVDSVDRSGRTPLYLAAERGYMDVVQLLLENGAEIESRDTNDIWMLLSWAAEYGHQAVVQLLLGKGAGIESRDTFGRTPLSCAAEYGRQAVVQFLLENGADIESRDTKYGRTPLSRAAESGYQAVVQLLLGKGAEIESRDTSGRTPLSWAAEHGHQAVVQLLLESGAEIESRDTEYSWTPLSWAAERGCQTVVQLLLEKGAEIESKDMKCGRTPLTLAAQKGHDVIVRLLLDKGAEIDSVDRSGRTPLYLAAERGHEAVVQLLLEKGAEVESRDANEGRTLLSWAAEHGHQAAVQLLLDKGVGVDSRDKSGRTPLSWAAGSWNEIVLQLLLDKGAEIESRDSSGRTPLSWAAERGHQASVQLLLGKGAEIESRDTSGRTPLSWAAEHGREAVVQLLLEKGGKVESRDTEYGRTPLSWAANGDVVQQLLDKGAEIESRDTSGRTPLSWASKHGYYSAVHLLLDKGAEIESRDTSGRTPLSWAAEHGYYAVVRLLLDTGAEIASRDSSGRTPLSWAAESGNQAIVQLLLDKGAESEPRDTELGQKPLS